MHHLGRNETPRELALVAARTLARRASLAATEGAWLDPACGSGNLLLAACEVGLALGRLRGIELDPARAREARRRLASATGASPGTFARRVRTGDALDPARAWPRGSWVLANPPWVSYSGRQAPAAPPPAERSAGGWPALHSTFLERIARHVASQGTGACVLVPASVTELARYAPLRERLHSLVRLEEAPLELGDAAFPGVHGSAVLLSLGPRRSSAPDSAAPDPATWSQPPTPAASALVAELARLPALPPSTFADPGVHTGNSARELLRSATDGPGPGVWEGVRRGRDLAPFRLASPTTLLRTDLVPGRERRFRLGQLERARAFPLLLRQTADRPIAALHTQPTWFRNSLLACRGVPGLDPAFLVAVLNGPVAAAWHRLSFRDARQKSFPQVKVAHLATQRSPLASRDDAPQLHDRVAAEVERQAVGRGTADGLRALQDELFDAYGLSPASRALVLELAGGPAA